MIQTTSTGSTDAFSLIVSKKPALFYRTNGFNKAADCYIQLHDSATVPANNAVPKKSWIAQSNFEFNEHVSDGIPCLNGICLVLSSTDNKLTIMTTTPGDIQCEWEVYDSMAVKPTLSVAGDTVTGVNSLSVWAGAAGPKDLVDITWTNNEAGSCFLQAFGIDNPPNGTVPVWESPLVAAAGSASYYFGFAGRYIRQQDSALVNHVGCTLAVSSTAGVLTIGVATASFIQAHYHA